MCRICCGPGYDYECHNCGRTLTPPKFDTLDEETAWVYSLGWISVPATGSRNYCSAFCLESNWPYGWWDYERMKERK